MIRYFGLKLLINSETEAAPNDLVSKIQTVQFDVLLSPFAILISYYTSVIFLRDIRKSTSSKQANQNGIRLEPLNVGELNATHIDDIRTVVTRFYRFLCQHSNIVSNFMIMVI